jgi:mannose-6-phosphate isomerase-like protein (cupin superfamily)
VSAPTVIPPGGGEVVGDSPDRRVEILAEHDALHATWARFGPRRAGADLHVHREHTDLFYVLEGELTVMLADRELLVPAGALARVPPLVVHGFRNGTDAELRYLNMHAPGTGFADYMRGLRDGRKVPFDQWDPPADGGRPPSTAVIGFVDEEELVIAELTVEPGAPAAARGQSLYVLEGELAIASGEHELRATAGSWVDIPAGARHTFTPAGSGPVRVLTMHTPSYGFGALDQRPAD